MNLELFNYGQTKKPQSNAMAVRLKWLTLYYSYTTVVGISVCWGNSRRLILMKNPSSNTTSRHLKWIRRHFYGDNVEWNVSQDRFNAILDKIMSILPNMDTQLCDEILSIMGDKDAQRRDGVG